MIYAAKLFARVFKKQLLSSKRTITMDRYVWIDLEMTGLDVSKDTILEVACIITTPSLNPVHEGTNFVIHHPDEVLNSMNSWCIEHHGQTGLTEASKQSKISLSEAENMLADYIKKHTVPNSVNYLAGNSVYMDRIFLNKYMPAVSNLLHYRIIDISSIKILCSHWYPSKYEVLCKKKCVHRALDDINESIEELRKYRDNIFK